MSDVSNSNVVIMWHFLCEYLLTNAMLNFHSPVKMARSLEMVGHKLPD